MRKSLGSKRKQMSDDQIAEVTQLFGAFAEADLATLTIDAPVLLLDEATSALDSEVEAAIQASLYRLMEGKTVVAIAHRLSTIAAMDRLIVLDQGRIVEQGTHAELLAQGGLYARLWAHQSGGFLGEEDTGEVAPSVP